jgi:heat shock protein 4
MSVFGVDFGNLNSRVAVTRRGGVDVILNEISKRDNASYVSFGEKERYIGEKGLDMAVRNQSNTINNLKRFQGMRADSPALAHEMSYMPVRAGPAEDGTGDLEFEVMYAGEQRRFRPQQVLGMLLNKLKDTVEYDSIAMGGPATKGQDCVVSCPVYYTVAQRKALLQACHIAGMNCMGLLNETTAAGLDYGIFKSGTFPEYEDGKVPGHIVYFTDIGHSATTITAISFWKGHMKVIGSVYNIDLGTREIDNILLDYFREEIKKKYKGMDIFENKKAKFRVLQACDKLKTMLSANPIAPLNLECLMNDVDVSFPTNSRDDMEAMIRERFIVPFEDLCRSALKIPGVPVGTPVELLGGGSRIPALKALIAKVFEVTPSTTVNATEAVAKGCAILAAILSPKFKVREYNIVDCGLYNMSLGYHSTTTSAPNTVSFLPQVNKVMTIFKAGDSLPKSLDLTFDRTENFDLYYFYDEAHAADIVKRFGPSGLLVGHITVGNCSPPVPPTPCASAGSSKVRVRFRFSLTGLVEVESAQAVLEYEVDEEAPKDPAAKEGEPPKEPIRKKKEKKADATIQPRMHLGMPPEAVIAATKLENTMFASDRLVFETLEAKNGLEGYSYDYRHKVVEPSGELHKYTAPADATLFSKLCDEAEAWLYTDAGADAPKAEYQKRLDELKAIGDKALARFRNADDLPLATKQFEEAIQGLFTRWSALKPDTAGGWHTEAELAGVKSKCEEALQWLQSTRDEYTCAKPYEEPKFTAAALKSRLTEVERVVNPVLNKSKPAPPPPPPAPAAPAADGADKAAPPAPEGDKKNGMDVD